METVKLLHQNTNNGFKSCKIWWGMFLLHFIRCFLLSFSFWVLFWECIFWADFWNLLTRTTMSQKCFIISKQIFTFLSALILPKFFIYFIFCLNHKTNTILRFYCEWYTREFIQGVRVQLQTKYFSSNYSTPFFPKIAPPTNFFVFQKTNFCDIAFSCCFVSEVPSMPSVGWAVKTTGTTWKWTTLTSISSTISMLDKFLDSRMTSCRKLKQEISEQKIKGPKQV